MHGTSAWVATNIRRTDRDAAQHGGALEENGSAVSKSGVTGTRFAGWIPERSDGGCGDQAEATATRSSGWPDDCHPACDRHSARRLGAQVDIVDSTPSANLVGRSQSIASSPGSLPGQSFGLRSPDGSRRDGRDVYRRLHARCQVTIEEVNPTAQSRLCYSAVAPQRPQSAPPAHHAAEAVNAHVGAHAVDAGEIEREHSK